MHKFLPYVFKTLWGHRTRSLLTLTGAAVALFVFAFVGGIHEGMRALAKSQDGDRSLIVFQKYRFCPETSRLPEDYGRTMAKLPGVEDWLPTKVLMNNCGATLDLIVFHGVPPDKLRSFRELTLLSGDWDVYSRQRDAALVGQTVAKRRGLKTGDHFTMGEVTVRVAGVFASPVPVEENMIYTQLEFLQYAPGQNSVGMVTQFEVKVAEGADPAEVSRAIDTAFQADRVQTDTRGKGVFEAFAVGDLSELIGLTKYLGHACVILVLTLVLYPYVYVLGRSAFLGQSRQAIEAARSLGRTYGQAVRQVALPLARPALAAGAALAVMEALADFGAVNLLGVQALTSAIYRVWHGAFDQDAALQLATVLVGLALTMVMIERLLRGRARYHQALGSGDAVAPVRLRGWKAAVAAVPGWVLLLVVFVLPVVQLAAWSVETVADGAIGDHVLSAARNTLLLGVIAAACAVVTSTVVAYGERVHTSTIGHVAARLATIGYAVPGTVVAVAVYVPLVWVDRRLVDLADGALGISIELLFTGTMLGLVIAYVVRFHTLAFFAVEARMGRISPSLDDAARSLGADRARVLADVHLPLLRPGILTAALLVLVEVMKELPATALLRPLGGDTLAVTVWEATKDARFDVAALPALLIVAVGLVPVILLVRLSRRDGWASAAEQV